MATPRTPRLTAFFAGLIAAASFSWLTLAAAAQEPPSAMIVLDGSGSMWGRLDGDKKASKLELAREALRSNLATTPATANLGLMSYGHRRAGDCNDIEAILPLAAGDPARFSPPLDKLNPRGKGPVAEALRQAAAALGKSNPASIILIHDNADNCRQDPCEAASQIAAANPNVKINLVSLGIDPDELARISCVAKATGGQVFDVREAANLSAAVTDAFKVALLAQGTTTAPIATNAAVPKAATPTAAPSAPPSLVLAAKLVATSPNLAVPVRWRVFKSGGDQPVVEATASTLSTPLDPGNYTVEANVGFATARKSVDVAEKGPTRLDVSLEAAALRVTAKDLAGGAASTTALIALKAATPGGQPSSRPLWIGRTQEADFILPAGTYAVRATDSLAQRDETLTLAPGNVVNKDLIMGTGHLELTASAQPDGPALDGVTFLIAKDDPESPDGRREIARSASQRPAFALPAGTYYVTARTGTAEVRQRIAVSAGDNVKRAIAFGLAKLIVTPDIPAVRNAAPTSKPAIQTRILSLEGDPRELARSEAASPEFKLAAGRYRIESTVTALNLKAVQDIDLDAGSTRRAAPKLDASTVTLRLTAATASPSPSWEIRDAQGGILLRSNLATPSVLVAPGRYTARLEINDRRLEKPLEIAAGDQPRTLDFTLP
ncbi:MAG: VWA domain-containing protein [Hyphomicrobiaceae bacterium]